MMETREKKALMVAEMIWTDIKKGTSVAVYRSWSVTSPCATLMPWYFDENHRPTVEMPAIKMTVHGFRFQGNVYVAYDELLDRFHIFASVPDKGFLHPASGEPMTRIPKLLDEFINVTGPMEGEKNHCLQAN